MRPPPTLEENMANIKFRHILIIAGALGLVVLGLTSRNSHNSGSGTSGGSTVTVIATASQSPKLMLKMDRDCSSPGTKLTFTVTNNTDAPAAATINLNGDKNSPFPQLQVAAHGSVTQAIRIDNDSGGGKTRVTATAGSYTTPEQKTPNC